MKKIFTIIVAVLLAFGCEESMHEELVNEADLKSGKMEERTFKVHRASGIMEAVMNNEACPDYGIQILISGEGNATFLGNFSVRNWFCQDDLGNPIPPIMGELTAANGDKIYVVVVGYREDDVTITRYYDYMIIPGMATGRFEGVTGYYTIYGTVDYSTLTWCMQGEGKIIF